jgi:hypothetical protein
MTLLVKDAAAYERIKLETLVVENKHFSRPKNSYTYKLYEECVKPFLQLSFQQAIQSKSEPLRQLLSEGAALAIFEVQYPFLGNILRFAYDQYLILNIGENVVEFLVARHETEIMKVLVKAIVQLTKKD